MEQSHIANNFDACVWDMAATKINALTAAAGAVSSILSNDEPYDYPLITPTAPQQRPPPFNSPPKIGCKLNMCRLIGLLFIFGICCLVKYKFPEQSEWMVDRMNAAVVVITFFILGLGVVIPIDQYLMYNLFQWLPEQIANEYIRQMSLP